MEVKKIKVQKDGVVKEVNAHEEKNYVRAGWIVVKSSTTPFADYRRK